jgi:hypothetical protein
MSAPKLKKAKCAGCGSARHTQWHQLAGRLFNILVALCSACHAEITTGLARLKIETSKAKGSTIHGCRAIVYFLWFFLDKLLARLEKENANLDRHERKT